MFCKSCGSKLMGSEKYCPNCGAVTNEAIQEVNPVDSGVEKKRVASIVLGIIALCGLPFLLLSPISLILSIIGLVLAIRANKQIKNAAGIVLNAIGLFISSIITMLIILALLVTVNLIKNGPGDYTNTINEFVEKYQSNNHNF